MTNPFLSCLRWSVCLLVLPLFLAGMCGCRNKGTGTIPVVNLAEPAGWTKSSMEPLPPEDFGFSVAYQHESGLTLTLYQYSRGKRSIPTSLQTLEIQAQMNYAKEAIREMEHKGYLEIVSEQNSQVVLGESSQQALWSRFRLTMEGQSVLSDIYVWSKDNQFLKIRCSGLRGDDADRLALDPLLTSLGRPVTKNHVP
ncbi:hypothetical protein [Lignipirellula cremea]|uniref:DUF1795 domain-containing protein n=1 Tax=Lignipirellula cremea TaxID=2528010 RepID=A0A518DZN1_9BACT|nr:hypothetical protein [Lignipirellula cremea]QDU97289.1 hypothetical protein Pla8534_51350 [Lignipirellula cremea]